MRIWYRQQKHTEAPRSAFRTLLKISDPRYKDANKLPAPHCTHLVIESDLDGYVVNEEYATFRVAAEILVGNFGKL